MIASAMTLLNGPRIAVALLTGTFLLASVPAWSNPPPHAPAHGWRAKHDPYYLGFTGKRWNKDYGISAGRCDRVAVGAVLGGVVGGAVGSQVGSGDTRRIAILIGTAAGAVLGAEIARNMAPADEACLAHALELGATGRPVYWDVGSGAGRYTLTPGAALSGNPNCRSFTMAFSGESQGTRSGVACRSPSGEWTLRDR